MNGTQPRCIQKPMGTCFAGIGGGQAHMDEMRHERFAGLEHLVRLGGHVHREADVAAQLVADDVERRFENAGDGGNRAAFVAQALDLRAERVEINHHRHRALHEREVVAIGGRRRRCGATSVEMRGSQTL